MLESIIDTLETQPFPTIIYGSFATDNNTQKSDLDLFFIDDTTDSDENFESLLCLVLDIHSRHGLKIDNEVPYKNKLIVNSLDLRKSLRSEGFNISNDDLYIPEIEKSHTFLNSYKVRLRLIFNAFTTPHIILNCLDESLSEMRSSFEIKLVLILLALHSSQEKITFSSLLHKALYSEAGASEDMYLGYKINETVINNLKMIISSTLKKLENTGIVCLTKNQIVLTVDKEELLSIIKS